MQADVQNNFKPRSDTLSAHDKVYTDTRGIVFVFGWKMSLLLFHDPDVIILGNNQMLPLVRLVGVSLVDEPTTGLDPSSQRQVWDIIHTVVSNV